MWKSTSPPSLLESYSQFPYAGQNIYSCIPQDSFSLGNGIVQQSGLQWTSSSNVDISGPEEFIGPFISFLSGPPPSLHGGFPQSSNLKPVFTLNEKPINRNSANGSTSRNGSVPVPAVELSHYSDISKGYSGNRIFWAVVPTAEHLSLCVLFGLKWIPGSQNYWSSWSYLFVPWFTYVYL